VNQLPKPVGKLNRGNPNWKKGQKSANPHGRPKKEFCIPDILRTIGDRPPTDFLLSQVHALYGPDYNPTTMREGMLMAMSAEAFKGNLEAMKFIADRTEGKVQDSLLIDSVPNEIIFREVRSGDGTLRDGTQVTRRIVRE